MTFLVYDGDAAASVDDNELGYATLDLLGLERDLSRARLEARSAVGALLGSFVVSVHAKAAVAEALGAP